MAIFINGYQMKKEKMQKNSAFVGVWIDSGSADKLKKLAVSKGISLSAFIRYRLFLGNRRIYALEGRTFRGRKRIYATMKEAKA